MSACAMCGCRCSIIQSISLGFKALTEELDELSPSPCPHPHPRSSPPSNMQTPPNPSQLCENITGASPRGETEGERDLEERGESTTTTAASKSQQPGEGVWVIFYGR